MLVSLTPAAGGKVSERRLKHDEAVLLARHKRVCIQNGGANNELQISPQSFGE